MKADAIEAATAMLHEMKSRIMALPGMHQFINSIHPDGTGCIVSMIESRELSDANEPAVQSIWAHNRDDLLAIPEASGFDVIVDWRNWAHSGNLHRTEPRKL